MKSSWCSICSIVLLLIAASSLEAQEASPGLEVEDTTLFNE